MKDRVMSMSPYVCVYNIRVDNLKPTKQPSKRTNEQRNKQTNKRTNKRTSKRTNKQTNKQTRKDMKRKPTMIHHVFQSVCFEKHSWRQRQQHQEMRRRVLGSSSKTRSKTASVMPTAPGTGRLADFEASEKTAVA